ncbi:MAG: L-threonylcarbamoyladenylate synthase [Candidatus Nanoarchaeia archaeon]|nr:L-threonylcarbamoyladenylate synthase [Candidatus Nanoarchaeia archaeon]
MEVINSKDFIKFKNRILTHVRRGGLICYPTDTAYGIGCVIDNENSIKKLREIKQTTSPFSIIVPNKDWIHKNCHIEKEHHEYLDLLPGPYTLVLSSKTPMPYNLNLNKETIAVRIPDHWISSFVNEVKVPIITTTINLDDDEILKHHSQMPKHMEKHVSYFIDEGEFYNGVSSIISLHKGYNKLR